MIETALERLGRWIAIAAALTLSIGCVNQSPVSPSEAQARPAAVTTHTLQGTGVALAAIGAARAADIDACPKLKAPEGTKLAWHVYAKGVQIYRWTGTAWTLVGPSAVLSADAEGNSVVGTHYVGPTWESNSGSKVVGAVIERCTPNPNAIPWLLLGAVSSEGPGVLHRVTHIQRLNTVGGVAPSTPGGVVGEEARIEYSTEYFFYR